VTGLKLSKNPSKWSDVLRGRAETIPARAMIEKQERGGRKDTERLLYLKTLADNVIDATSREMTSKTKRADGSRSIREVESRSR